MITGLKVHTSGGVLPLNAVNENTSTSELLADIVSATQTGSTDDWTLREASVSGRVLGRDLTLRQNHVGNNQVLYLVPLKTPVDQELNLEIAAPDGQTLHFEVRSSTPVSLLLAQVPVHFGLGALDGKGRPAQWCLTQESTGKRLDSTASLGENGISRHDRLLLEQETPIANLELEGVGPGGQTCKLDLSPGFAAANVRDELLGRFGLPKTNYAGDLIEWSLRDSKTKQRLDLKKTLAENGVQSGNRLLLEAEPGACVVVNVSAEGISTRSFAQAGDTPTAAFIQTLVNSLGLGERANDGQPHVWHLTDARGKTLAPEKTLAANGVATADDLTLVLALTNLRLDISAPSHSPFTTEEPGSYLTGELARQLVWKLRLPLQDERGHDQEWHLRRNGSPKSLDNDKTLAANGLVDGDRLELIPISRHTTRNWRLPSLPAWAWPLALVVVAVLGLGVWHFGGGVKPRVPAAISIVPATRTLSAGESASFAPHAANGEIARARWSITPAVGAVTANGVYKAPPDLAAEQIVTLTATRDDAPLISASATLHLMPKQVPPTHDQAPANGTAATGLQGSDSTSQNPSAISISPKSATVGGGQHLQMVLRPPVQTPVQWTLQPVLGSVSNRGLYTAPATVSKMSQIQVTASAEGVSAISHITLQPVSVGAVSVASTENRQYVLRAPVTNTNNTGLIWSIQPQTGSITQNGVYTAPAEVPSAQTVQVTATSVVDPAQSSHFDLHLAATTRSNLRVSINPHSPGLNAGQREQFTATVTGSSNTSVTWSSSGLGTISPGGVFTAPASVPSAGATVHIYATSNADRKQIASTDISLRSTAAYTGPKTGVLTWQGKVGGNQTITIGNGIAGTSGSFPGFPIEVTVSDKNLQIVSAPSVANGWKSMVVQTHKKEQAIQVTWKMVESSLRKD